MTDAPRAHAIIVRGGGSVATDCLLVLDAPADTPAARSRDVRCVGRRHQLRRHLYEYQYLGPGLGSRAVTDPRTWLVRSTWFDDDFFASGALDERDFDTLADAVARLCACWAVDETRFVGVSDSGASSRRARTAR